MDGSVLREVGDWGGILLDRGRWGRSFGGYVAHCVSSLDRELSERLKWGIR